MKHVPSPCDNCFFVFFLQYFETRFTCPVSTNGTSHVPCKGFQDSFENYFSVAAMSSVAITSALNIYIQSK